MSGLLTNRMSLIAALCACGVFALTGCNSEPKGKSGSSTTAATTAGGHGHDHDAHAGHNHEKGPHGGPVLELSGAEGHLELVFDSEAGKLSAFVLDEKMKDITIAVPELKLQVQALTEAEKKKGDLGKEGVVVLKAVGAKDGKATEFTGTSDVLKGAKEFSAVIDTSFKVEDKTVEKMKFDYPPKH